MVRRQPGIQRFTLALIAGLTPGYPVPAAWAQGCNGPPPLGQVMPPGPGPRADGGRVDASRVVSEPDCRASRTQDGSP